MDGNPYSALLAMLRSEGAERSSTGETSSSGLGAIPIKMRLGTVRTESPLQVDVAGVTMPPAALRVNAIINGSLKTGDAVLLLTGDDQVFYIVMKVVAA